MSSERMALGVLFVTIVVLASLAPARSDTWWQIRAGQDIWQSGEVPLVDTYSHTIRGRPWPNQEWLTELIFYTAHRLAGMPGVAVLCMVLIAFSWGVSWALMSGRFELRFMLFVLSLTASAGAWAMRPQLLTMACFMVVCWLLATRRLWWLPLHILVWANLHGAVVLGVIAIGAVVLAETIRTRRIPLELVLVGLASAAMTLVTPLGADLWALLAVHGVGARGDGIDEWMRPGLPPANLAFWAVVAALVAGVLFRVRMLDVSGSRLTAISLAMLPFALTAKRSIAVFLLVAVPAVSVLWSRAAGASPSKHTDRSKKNTAILIAASVAAVLFVARVWTHPPDTLGWSPIQPGAAAALEACPAPIYNTYDDGGALIWFVPKQPVFIDSRYDPYSVEHFRDNETAEMTGVFRPLFDKYDINCAIVPLGLPIDSALRRDSDWMMTYSDYRHVVYVAR